MNEMRKLMETAKQLDEAKSSQPAGYIVQYKSPKGVFYITKGGTADTNDLGRAKIFATEKTAETAARIKINMAGKYRDGRGKIEATIKEVSITVGNTIQKLKYPQFFN